VSPFPVQMENHWVAQPGEDPTRTQLIWFLRLGDHPVVAELAGIAQARLTGIGGLDLVPREWLHMTTLIAGFSNDITVDQADAMARHARQLLAGTEPIRLRLGRILYHPRAIMLDARPHDALDPMLAGLREATRLATGHEGQLYHNPWVPHITVAYSNMAGPAAPVIDALGLEVPQQEVSVNTVSLISQAPEHGYAWQPVADVQFGC
jgi:2'-5' RNA ligase